MKELNLLVAIHKRIALTLAVILVLGCGLLAGGHVARAADHEQPVGVYAISDAPRVVTVYWIHSGDGVFRFDIEEKTTNQGTTVDCPCAFGPGQKSIGDLQPNTPYQFRVCAVYDAADTDRACSDANNVGYYPVTTMGPAPTGSTSLPAPSITGYVPSATSIYITWGTPGFNVDFDMFTIRVRQKAAPGAPDNAFRDIDVSDGGATGAYAVGSLTPNTTYQFQVRGCFKDFFVFNGCPNAPWGLLSEATTLFTDAAAPPLTAGGLGDPAPVIYLSVPSDTSMDILWRVSSGYHYNNYVIQYQPQAAGGAQATVQVSGDQSRATVSNLTPQTTYVFTVKGCDSTTVFSPNAQPSTQATCTAQSAPYTAATVAAQAPLNTGGGTIIGNLKATITVSPPTINPGNTVTITGSSFPLNDGPVSVGYSWSATNPTGGGSSSGSGGGSPVTTVSSQGTFSATLTIPSDVPPTSVTISAQSKTASATATVQVVAPSSKGTLTLTYTPLVGSGGVVTDFAPDTSGYVLSGTNFAPGQVTIFLDSAQGSQLMTATVGADGKFSAPFEPSSAQTGGKIGQHTLVAVQNGAVAGQLSVTVDPPVHVG